MWYLVTIFFAFVTSKELLIKIEGQTQTKNPGVKLNNSHLKKWDLTMGNINANDVEALSWCKIFKTPNLNKKHHIIGYDPLRSAHYTPRYSPHHIAVSRCLLNDEDNLKEWVQLANKAPEICATPQMRARQQKCFAYSAAWYDTKQGERFPKHVGIPLENGFYMMEFHFYEPLMFEDTSGLRLYYTDQLRENEGDLLMVGSLPTNFLFIPPNQKEFSSVGYCSEDCTEETFPEDGIKIVSALFHSHSTAQKINLKQFRNGTEVATLVDHPVDYKHQIFELLPQEATILPGDGLLMECTYSTLNKKKPIYGGTLPENEMCQGFIFYYPKIEMTYCTSVPSPKHFFELVGVKELHGKSFADIEDLVHNIHGLDEVRFRKLVIKEPKEFNNQTLESYLEKISYDDTFVQKINKTLNHGLHLPYCGKNDIILNETHHTLVKVPRYESLDTSSSTSMTSNFVVLFLGISTLWIGF